MPADAYSLNDLRRVVPLSLGKFAPATADVSLITVPDGLLMRLIAMSWTYHMTNTLIVSRSIVAQVHDPSGNTIIPAAAGFGIAAANVQPPAQSFVSVGIGGFGTESGAGNADGSVEYNSLGTIDTFFPAGYSWHLVQFGFDGVDSATGGFAIVEYVVAQSADSSGNPNFGNNAKAIAYYLNTAG